MRQAGGEEESKDETEKDGARPATTTEGEGEKGAEGDKKRSKASVQRQCATSNHRLSRFPPPIPDLLPLLLGTVPLPPTPPTPPPPLSPPLQPPPPPPPLPPPLLHPRSTIMYSTDTHERHATCAPERSRRGSEGTERERREGGDGRSEEKGKERRKGRVSTSSRRTRMRVARSAAHLSVSPEICTHTHTHTETRVCMSCAYVHAWIRAHSRELVWYPAVERWKTRGARHQGGGSRRVEMTAKERGGRIMRVSTQRARMKARVFSAEGQRIGHEGDAHADE